MINVTVSTDIFENADGNTPFQVDTTAISNFSIDLQSQIDAAFADDGALDNAFEVDPTSVSASAFVWGTGDNTVTLSGSGIDPISSVDDLMTAIDNGVAEGTLNSISAVYEGEEIVSLTWSDAGITLASGAQSFTLKGDMPSGLQDIVDVIDNLDLLMNSELSESEVNDIITFLQDFSFTGIQIQDDGANVFDLTLATDGITLSAGNIVLAIGGAFPSGSIGELIETLTDFEEDSESGSVDLSDYDNLGLTSLTLSDTDGNVLISATGEVDNPDTAELGTVTINAGSDPVEIGDPLVTDATSVQVNLSSGDDEFSLDGTERSIEAYNAENYDFGTPYSPMTVDAGDGYDDLIITDTFGPNTRIDLQEGKVELLGFVTDGGVDAPVVHTTNISNFERIVLQEVQDVVIVGSDGQDRVAIVDIVNGFQFDGAGGTDRIELHRTANDDGSNGLTRAQFEAQFDFAEEDDGWIVIREGGDEVARIRNVEDVRFRTDDGGTETVTVNELLGIGGASDGTLNDDVLVGTTEDDSINGFAGDDEISGLAGNDELFGGTGDDEFDGGPGNDTIDGGDGYDEVDYDNGGSAGVTVNLATGTATDQYGDTDTLSNIEEVDGTDFADTMTGGSGFVEFNGRDGDDVLTAGSGGADLEGHEGNDTLTGGSGDDYFVGGPGDDTIDGGSDSEDDDGDFVDYIHDFDDGGTGGITADIGAGTIVDPFGDTDTVSNVEGLRGTNQADSVTAGDDFFYADLQGGNDTFVAGNGGSFVRTGSGNDSVTGGEGYDQVSYSHLEDGPIIADMSAGTVTDTAGNVDTLSEVERVRGTEFDDTFIGGDFFVEFTGDAGDDTVTAGSGGAYAQLGAGDDTFEGHDDGFDEVDYRWDNDRGSAGIVATVIDGSAEIDDGLGGSDIATSLDHISATNNADDVSVENSEHFSFLGAAGDDTFSSTGTGSTFVRGGEGNDTISGSTEGYDVIDYGRDEDEGGNAGINANLLTGQVVDGFGDTDTVSNIDEIRGTDSADTMVGSNDGTRLYGGDGNDTLTGGSGRDSINGGEGDDTIITGTNEEVDVVIGSSGNDTIDYRTSTNGYQHLNYGSLGAGLIVTINTVSDVSSVDKGGNGTDTILGASVPAAMKEEGGWGLGVVGTSSDDVFNLTSNSTDWLGAWGMGGNNTYNIADGSFVELLYESQPGNILPTTGIVADLSAGQVSNNGFGGTDTIVGHVSELTATSFDDDITGSDTGQRINTMDGNDTINAGAGNDVIEAGAGNDTINAGAGDDIIILGSGNNTVDGGSGTDLLFIDPTEELDESYTGYTAFIDLENGVVSGVAPGGSTDQDTTDLDASVTSTVSNIENVEIKGDVDAVIFGDDADNEITTDLGDDDLFGGAGNDTLEAGEGENNVDGGDGEDTAVFNVSYDDAEIEVSDTGEVTITTVDGASMTISDILTNIENFQFSDQTISFEQAEDGTSEGDNEVNGTDGVALDVTAGGGNDTVNGADADDVVDAGTGNDNVNGGAGNDTVDGGEGDDTVDGGEGDDTLDGGTGNDNVAGGTGNDTVDGGEGDDTIDGGAGDDNLDGGTGNDNISGGDGDDTIFDESGGVTADGGEGGDIGVALTGNATFTDTATTAPAGADDIDDFYCGSFGWDNISTGLGNDIIVADLYSNFLSGNDTVNGGKGNDILQGGFGADTFIFAQGDGEDTIARIDMPTLWSALGTGKLSDVGFITGVADFEVGVDKVNLTGFAGLTADTVNAAITDNADGNAVFQIGTDSITFVGVSAADLDADSFVF